MRKRPAILLVLALAMACSSVLKTDYPLVRQYPGELPPDPGSEPAVKPAPKRHLHLEDPEGWDNVTDRFPSPDGTIVVYARKESGPAIIAVHGSMSPRGETMEASAHRISKLVADAKEVAEMEVDENRASFDWSSGDNAVGHVIVIRLEDAPGLTIAFLGFGIETNIDGIKEALENLADSAEISE